jgi:hypothetical protein
MRAASTCIIVTALVISASGSASAQSLDRFFRGLNDAKRLSDEVSKALPVPPAPAPQPRQSDPASPTPSTKPATPVQAQAPSPAVRAGAPDYSSAEYDKQRYAQFVVPEATQKLAEGERKITVQLDVNETRQDTSGWVMQRTVSNPYLPLEPYILVPQYQLLNHLLQPHGRAQKISIGLQKSPGFFTEIERMRCMPNGELLVQGKAGWEMEGNTAKGYAGGYANGVWKVADSGAITPYAVFPGVGRRFDVCGDMNSCETTNASVWARAKQALPQSYGGTEDKHGNVWVLNNAEPGGWSVVRFNKDGSDKVVLDREFLQEKSANKDDWMAPAALRYDSARDEMVFVHQVWGSGDGAMGIWRITQSNEPKEVLRFLTRSKGALSKPSPNLVKIRASEIVRGLAVDPEGTIWLAVADMSGSYPSQAYQVVDSIKSMKKLPYATAGQNVYEDLIRDLRLNRKTDAREATLLKTALGQQACFEPTGKYLYIRDPYVGIARLEVKTGRMTTWVR